MKNGELSYFYCLIITRLILEFHSAMFPLLELQNNILAIRSNLPQPH